MDVFRFPLISENQEFDISVINRELKFFLRWNNVYGYWFFDIYEQKTLAPLILSLPITSGVNLLEGYRYVGLDVEMYLYTQGDEFKEADYDSIGKTSNVFLVVQP